MKLQFPSMSVNCAFEMTSVCEMFLFSGQNCFLLLLFLLRSPLFFCLSPNSIAFIGTSVVAAEILPSRLAAAAPVADALCSTVAQKYLTACCICLQTACHNGEIVPDCIDLRLYLESSLTENSQLRLLQLRRGLDPSGCSFFSAPAICFCFWTAVVLRVWLGLPDGKCYIIVPAA